MLDLDIDLTVGSLHLDLDLTVESGEIVAVLGPNGVGKTTMLRATAGLLAMRRGRVVVDGVVLEDTDSDIHVPTERRPIGYVFQDYLLFPHLSALENVAFGLRARRVGRVEARRRAGEWLDRVGLADCAGLRPRALSGGQAQRVALARALVTEPRVLLLDEPLAALDASTKLSVRAELRRHLAGFAGTRVLVTHDPLDALALADRLVVVEDGRIVQSGVPSAVASHPRSSYVADLVGVNLYRGVGRAGLVELAGGGSIAAVGTPDGEVFVVVHPRAVALHRGEPAGSPRNVWRGRVADVTLQGDRVRVHVAGTPEIIAEVTPGAVAELGLAGGEEVWVSVKATEVVAYPD